MNDAEFRVIREALGITTDKLAILLSTTATQIQRWEHGTDSIPSTVSTNLNKIIVATETMILAEIEKARTLGYIETFRQDVELEAHAPEYASLGSLWHRRVANEVQAETDLSIRYPERRKSFKL